MLDTSRLIDIENLGNLYNFYRPGDGLVAGREVNELLMLPLDGFRYGYGVSLDSETHVALRQVILTPQRTPIERYEFVDIDFLPEAEKNESKSAELCQENSVDQQDSRWTALRLPEGFHTIRSSHDSESQEDELLISDGIATISVTLEPVDSPLFPPINTQLGATSILLVYLGSQNNLYMVTLVGETPLQSLEYIASGLNLSAETSSEAEEGSLIQ